VITIVHDKRTLHVEVRDEAAAIPERRTSPDGIGGFGLGIVTTLCRSWGWAPTSDGKVVWADLPCAPDDT
jgi:hypothetical protein